MLFLEISAFSCGIFQQYITQCVPVAPGGISLGLTRDGLWEYSHVRLPALLVHLLHTGQLHACIRPASQTHTTGLDEQLARDLFTASFCKVIDWIIITDALDEGWK